MMEANRNDCEKCIRIARDAASKGDYEKAIKFAEKAERLYPNEVAKSNNYIKHFFFHSNKKKTN